MERETKAEEEPSAVHRYDFHDMPCQGYGWIHGDPADLGNVNQNTSLIERQNDRVAEC